MITVIRKCDRCNRQRRNDKDFLWNVGVSISKEYVPQISGKDCRIQFCRHCMVLLGLLPSVQDDPPAPDPKPTTLEIVELLAEKLREREDA